MPQTYFSQSTKKMCTQKILHKNIFCSSHRDENFGIRAHWLLAILRAPLKIYQISSFSYLGPPGRSKQSLKSKDFSVYLKISPFLLVGAHQVPPKGRGRSPSIKCSLYIWIKIRKVVKSAFCWVPGASKNRGSQGVRPKKFVIFFCIFRRFRTFLNDLEKNHFEKFFCHNRFLDLF